MKDTKDIFKIERFDHFGNGVLKKNGYTIFVDRALPNELCRVQIYEQKKDYARAKICEILEPSCNRIVPSCGVYQQCGGCQLLHTKGEAEFKKQLLCELLQQDNVSFVEGEFFYRNKVVFHVEGDKIGFYEEKSHRIFPLDGCLLLDPLLKETYSFLKTLLPIPASSIMARVGNQEVMLVFSGKVPKNIIWPSFIQSVYQEEKLLYGKPYLFETLGTLQFRISPTSFFQVNTKMAEKLYERILATCTKEKNPVILDLYCGTGSIGLFISKCARKVIGIEVVASSIADASENAKQNHISNCEFLLGKVEDRIGELGKVDIVIMDPPRKGSDTKTISTILEMQPRRIIYVSCNPITLKRDLKQLHGYEIEEVALFNLFRGSYHVETFVSLKQMELSNKETL